MDADNQEVAMLRQTLRQINTEIANERKLMNDFQQQKEKLELFWITSKQKRDDLKMQLRNKLRQKQDLDEKHAFELKIYKQKVKHLLHEHQAHMTDVRHDGAIAVKLLEDSQRASEHTQRLDTRSLEVVKKEMEMAHKDLYKSIKLEQEKKVMALRQEYERKAQRLRDMYDQRMNTMITEMDEKRKEEVTRLETKKTVFIQNIMNEHRRAFDDVKAYYRDIKFANLEMIKGLKEDVEKLKEDEQQLQKEVQTITRINKKLSKPLEQNLRKVEELTEKLAVQGKEHEELQQVKDSLASLEERHKNATWEFEITRQRLERVAKERDELRKRLERAAHDVRQKTSFRGLVLERKLVATANDLEKTEAALSEVLASANLRPEVIGELRHSLEDVLMAKNKVISRLEDELVGAKQKYSTTLQLYEAKLREYSIPVEDIGFVPVRKI